MTIEPVWKVKEAKKNAHDTRDDEGEVERKKGWLLSMWGWWTHNHTRGKVKWPCYKVESCCWIRVQMADRKQDMEVGW